jgi:probable HAF family extracellular repeat protein
MQMLQGLGGTTTVNAINNKNHAVGRSFLPNYLNQMPMFWENGQTYILPSLGGSSSDAIAINDHDSIVGWSRFITGENHAVLWKANRIFDLGNFSSDTDTHPFSINNRSEIVGSSGSGFLSAYRAFYYKEHEFENLGTLPGDFLSGARDINNHGEIVGYSCSDLWDGSCKSVLWNSNHQMSPLEMVPGFPASYAYSINDCSEVVGYATIFGGSIDSRRAFVRTQNQIINLNSIIPLQQGMILREASSINNVGQIAGFGSMNGHAFGFILTPQ